MPVIRVSEEARDGMKRLKGIGVTYSEVILSLIEAREELLDTKEKVRTLVHP